MPSGNNEYGSKAVLPRDRFTIHILYSFFTEKPRPSGRGFFVSILIHPSLVFSSAGIISSARIHPQLALFHHRDYFCHPDSSLSCSFLPQGLFLLLRCISILFFSTTGIIATARIHPQLAFLCRRDDFFCADSSLSCSFSPQGLLLPPGFISILLFFSAGIISSTRMHPQLALLCRRDYFFRPDSSLSCSFVLQG